MVSWPGAMDRDRCRTPHVPDGAPSGVADEFEGALDVRVATAGPLTVA